MIIVTLFKKSDSIIGFSVEGHADFAEPGKDIVCSAVSALTFNAIDSIEKITADKMNYRALVGNISMMLQSEPSTSAFVLLTSFRLGMEAIAEQYPDNVRVVTVKAA